MSRFIKDIRAEYEKTLTPLAVIDQIHNEGRVLVVLESKRTPGSYHCHRYFKLGEQWVCSIDRQGVPLADVWGWLSKPKAKRPDDEEEETPAESTADFFPKGMENFHENGGDVLD